MFSFLTVYSSNMNFVLVSNLTSDVIFEYFLLHSKDNLSVCELILDQYYSLLQEVLSQ